MIQRLSRAHVPTLKETPADATNASHKFLLRGGYIRQIGAGLYDFLPLGLRALRNVEKVVREEMDKAGALEVLMPALLPADYFKETGRYTVYGDVLLRLKDRKGGEYHLGPTHEEIITDMVRRDVRSYRQLPLNLYQIQSKYRDEPRPRGGLMRGREFIMKDAYSFDVDEAAAQKSYEGMRDAYSKIFTRLGLTFRIVQADSGAIGGKTSAEFQILADSGEDAIVSCESCGYAANVEAAEVSHHNNVAANGEVQATAKVHTPGKGGIVDVAKFLKATEAQFLKSLVYVTAKKTLVMVCLRGDHEVNEVALTNVLGEGEVFLASEADVEKATGAKVGYAGPVGLPVGVLSRIVVDRSAASLVNAITGANETDYHFTGVNLARGDYNADIVDIRLTAVGDPCPRCASDKYRRYKGIEGGHIFILGTHYSAKMGATYLADDSSVKPIVMGCYGIGISRLVAAAVEQHHDADGIRWPVSIAPYDVHLCSLGVDEVTVAAALKLAEELAALGLDVLWDDRDERPGVKFKDADLVGMPIRVTIGPKTLANGQCEVKLRTAAPKEFVLEALAGAAQAIADKLATVT